MMRRRLYLAALLAVAVLAGACREGREAIESPLEKGTQATEPDATQPAATTAPAETATGVSPAPAGPPKPSIVFILTDDQRWDTLWGMPIVSEALAAHGVTFTNAFVTNPLCCPSRASVLTGRYSHSTGIYLNRPPHGGYEEFEDGTTIATVLHGAGYRTALIGKYLNGYDVGARGEGYVPPGWDRFVAFARGFTYYDYLLAEDGRIVRYGHEPSDYSTSVLAERAVEFIKSTEGPFFLYFAPNAPHAPAIPPPGLGDAFAHFAWWRPPSYNEQDLSDKPAYIRRIGSLTKLQLKRVARFRREQLETALGVDNAVRKILKALEATGRLGTTFIVYASDNGVAWGEHPLTAARKLVPYEEPIRVPLVVRYDPLIHEQPTEDGHLVLNVDLAPTFAALAGRSMPGADGRSLLTLLEDVPSPGWRKDFLIEHLAGMPQPLVPSYCAVRNERYVYVLYQTREEELYDLVHDPHELENLAGHPKLASVQAALRSRLAELCRPPPPGFTALEPASSAAG